MNKLLENTQHKYPSGAVFILLAVLSFLISGCATEHVVLEQSPVAEQEAVLVEEESFQQELDESDPYEGFNRSMYVFNDHVDTYVADPITTAYKWIFPQFLQTGVSNFYTNLRGISVVLNDVLQGKFKQGGSDTGRFLLNSTVGIAGIFDVATYAGLDQNNEDFDQTLAVWGVPPGSYLVLPFLGPTTARGIPGGVVDAVANPVTYAPWGFAAVAALNKRANAEGSLKFIDEAALDPYIFTRESFLQWREHLATDGASETSDLDFEDEYFDEEPAGQDAGSQPSVANDAIAVGDSTAMNTGDNLAPENSSLESESFEEAAQSFKEAENSFDEVTLQFQEAEQAEALPAPE